MKRLVPAALCLFFSALLIGCTTDSRPGLLSDTVNLINQAASEVGVIKTRVKEAVDRSAKESKKLDLTDAIKAADKLKETGDSANEIKKRVERVRGTLTEDEKKEFAKKSADQLNAAVSELVKNKDALRKQLIEAEQLGSAARIEVEKLREKLRDAEGPFESLAR